MKIFILYVYSVFYAYAFLPELDVFEILSIYFLLIKNYSTSILEKDWYPTSMCVSTPGLSCCGCTFAIWYSLRFKSSVGWLS